MNSLEKMYDKGGILVGSVLKHFCFADLNFVFRLRTAPDVYRLSCGIQPANISLINRRECFSLTSSYWMIKKCEKIFTAPVGRHIRDCFKFCRAVALR